MPHMELVDSWHDLGLMIFLDVVYNHFGPDGNYLRIYAPQFFATTSGLRGAPRSTFSALKSDASSSRMRCIG